jgi:hypothetical protein
MSYGVRGDAALSVAGKSRGGSSEMMMVVISRSHQSCPCRCYHSGPTTTVLPRVKFSGAGDCTLTQDRTTDSSHSRPVSQASWPLLAALHHSRLTSRHVLHVVVISTFVVSAARSRAVSRKLHHASHPSAIAADHSLCGGGQRQRLRGSTSSFASRFSNFTYSSGLGLAEAS